MLQSGLRLPLIYPRLASTKHRYAQVCSFSQTPKWVSLANNLDDVIGKREVNKLVSEDSETVVELLQSMYSEVDGIQMWQKRGTDVLPSSDIRCNLVAHFFVARFYDGDNLQIRAHYINQESEDNAHSHGSSFFSHCISGAYTHELWGEMVPEVNVDESKAQVTVDEGKAPVYYETVRKTSSLEGSEFLQSVKREGRFSLLEELSQEHAKGDLYYFEATDAYHKANPPLGSASPEA